MTLYPVEFVVNGRPVRTEVAAGHTLLVTLRGLGFVEVKCGCEKGDCGACAVMLNGRAVNSCLVLTLQAHGGEVETVRALGDTKSLHPLQESFVEHDAVQCGFCTPGMLISAKELLDANPQPSPEEIREGISGNLCRCTGYRRIVAAIEALARKCSPEGTG